MFEVVLPDCYVPIFMLLVLLYRTAYCSFLCHGLPLFKSQPNINEVHIFQAIASTVHVLSYANSCWPMLPAYFFLSSIPTYPKCKEKNDNDGIYHLLSAYHAYCAKRYTYISIDSEY